ncbi:hypothetical protein GCM10022406_01820 [Hymenobacter algoricola]|uniref:VOC domain-containing protein n=2 Tax=Hymenobacter algoricola TaxID=486267 RepID=A0ABP7MC71_9BACT
MCAGLSTAGYGQAVPAAGPGGQFAAQRTVVYPIRDAAAIQTAIDWYSAFFSTLPTRVDLTAAYPYAVYTIDGVEVRLETSPQYRQLREAVFYWVLPTPADVERKYAALDANPANKFERGLFQRVRQIDDRRASSFVPGAAAPVTAVKEFVVLDPAGNQVGVINNPIYTPPTTVAGE